MEKLKRSIRLFREMRALKKREWSPHDTCRDRVTERLRFVVQAAVRRIPYYRDLFRKAGIGARDIRTPEDLAAVPITTNKTVRSLPRENVTLEGVDFHRLVDRYSSGSTGIPLHTYLSPLERDLQALNAIRAFRAGGYRPTDILVDLTEPHASPPRFIEKFGLFRKRYISLLEDLADHARPLAALRPLVLLASGNVLEVLAEAMAAQNLEIRPRRIFTVGERLTRTHRKISIDSFGTDPFDVYGASEFGPIAYQCSMRSGFHVNTDSLVVQIVDPETGVPGGPGEAGQVVITSLINEVMPFIRYSVGDLAAFSKEPCPCGRGLPLIESIQGRLIQRLCTTRGDRVSPWGPTIVLEETPGVERYQLVQERVGAIRVRIRGGPVDRARLTNRLEKLLGKGLEVDVEYVDSLRPPGGRKFQLVVCKVPDREA